MADYLRVTQVRSAIGRPPNQQATLDGLRITQRGRTSYVLDTPSARGMVATVAHLVTWSEATAAERDAALSKKKVRSYEIVGGQEQGDA